MKNRIIAMVVGMVLCLFTIILFTGCSKTWTDQTINYQVANWTSDGNIVFIENINFWEHEKRFLFPEKMINFRQELWLWECGNNGISMNRVGLLLSAEPSTGNPTNISSAVDWVTFSISETKDIYVVRRNGEELKRVGSGTFPDFSPDATQIVYKKTDQGIWVMNRDGTGAFELVQDEFLTRPVWSNDSGKIAFLKDTIIDPNYQRSILKISDLSGTILFAFREDSLIRIVGSGGVDWGQTTLNALIIEAYNKEDNYERGFGIIYYDIPDSIDFISYSATGYKWSDDGEYLIATDSGGNFCVTFDLNLGILDNKWYIRP